MNHKKYPDVAEGELYGRWKVVRRIDDRGGKQYWWCDCACGKNSKPVEAYALRRGLSKSCGCLKRHLASQQPTRENSPRWRGGRNVSKEGYVSLYAPDHPAAKHKKYVREHRLVMENHLGRYLHDHEFVHHKNGDRGDNRIENLELWSRSHPYGQRVTDLLAWAKELQETYRDFIP
jgi:hypothetical protein